MDTALRKSAQSLLSRLPRRLHNAVIGAFPESAPGGFARLIEVERLRRLLGFLDVDCVLDIGANEGQYALQLRRMVGYKGRLISFEPIPRMAARVRQLARSDPNWAVEEIAVSDRGGQARFNVMASTELSSLSAPTSLDTDLLDGINVPVETIEVRCESLESVLDRLSQAQGMKRPFLKMDTQGHDMIIARGAAHILHRFVGIQTELAVKRLYETSVPIGPSIEFFQKAGFELSALVPNNAGHFPILLETDGLFIRSDLARG
jgi:FkbM family methyltransferase